MHDNRFDALTRSLIVARSRRDMLRLLSGILGGSLPLLAQGAVEARCRRRPCRNGTCAGCCDARGCCRAGSKDRVCGKFGDPCAPCSSPTPRCFESQCSQCREDLDCSAGEFCCLAGLGDKACDAGTCTACTELNLLCSRNRHCCAGCCDDRFCSAGTPEGGECENDVDCCRGLTCVKPSEKAIFGTCMKPR
jgi:hypothetical protein